MIWKYYTVLTEIVPKYPGYQKKSRNDGSSGIQFEGKAGIEESENAYKKREGGITKRRTVRLARIMP